MVRNEKDICPLCGGELQSRGRVKRYLRIGGGKRVIVSIARFSCRKCGHWHRVLPIDILPYKQYERDLIEGKVDINDILYEDYPCDMTKKRWQSHKKQLP